MHLVFIGKMGKKDWCDWETMLAVAYKSILGTGEATLSVAEPAGEGSKEV